MGTYRCTDTLLTSSQQESGATAVPLGWLAPKEGERRIGFRMGATLRPEATGVGLGERKPSVDSLPATVAAAVTRPLSRDWAVWGRGCLVPIGLFISQQRYLSSFSSKTLLSVGAQSRGTECHGTALAGERGLCQ